MISSAVEHCLHTAGVPGSKPGAPIGEAAGQFSARSGDEFIEHLEISTALRQRLRASGHLGQREGLIHAQEVLEDQAVHGRSHSSVGQSGSFLNCRSQVRSLLWAPFLPRCPWHDMDRKFSSCLSAAVCQQLSSVTGATVWYVMGPHVAMMKEHDPGAQRSTHIHCRGRRLLSCAAVGVASESRHSRDCPRMHPIHGAKPWPTAANESPCTTPPNARPR